MKKNFLNIILVVAIGVLVGMAYLSKQTKTPFFRVLYDQQLALLKGQEEIEDRLEKIIEEDQNSSGKIESGELGNILASQKILESRIQSLEKQIRGIRDRREGNNKPANQRPPQEDFSKVYDIPANHSPIIGKKDAPITLVEFVDIQCPFCARFHPPLAEAAKAYPDKVNYIVKNFPLPFHSEARSAAKVAFVAAQQGKYAEMLDLLLENNKQLNMPTYERLAKELGLNMDKFRKDLKEKDKLWEDYINKDMALGSKSDVRGTPTFFINGRKTRARDVESFKKEIEAILNK